MAPRRALAVLLLTALGAAACVSGPRGPTGPVVSPTGIVYPPGTPPARTRYSQTSALFLYQGRTDRALALAEEGLAADSTNPIHYFLAGASLLRLGRYQDAARMFTEAERIYPAYQLQTEPERAAGWAEAYDAGVQAYEAGNTEAAIEAWRNAAAIYDLRAEAHRNLASLLARDGQFEEAITLYQRALAGLERSPATHVLEEAELAARAEAVAATEASLAELLVYVKRYAEAEPLLRRQVARDSTDVQRWGDLAATLDAMGRSDEAGAIYTSLLSGRDMQSSDLFSLGVGLFRAGDYPRASEAFTQLTRLRPDSRDAWFNYVNSLLAGKAWAELARAGDRLVELDPLGKNVGLIAARAHLELGDEQEALRGVRRVDAAPVHVEGLRMQAVQEATRVEGEVTGNQAAPGTPLRLRFTFYREATELGSEIVEVTAPPPGETVPFGVLFAMRATGFRYELVP